MFNHCCRCCCCCCCECRSSSGHFVVGGCFLVVVVAAASALKRLDEVKVERRLVLHVLALVARRRGARMAVGAVVADQLQVLHGADHVGRAADQLALVEY